MKRALVFLVVVVGAVSAFLMSRGPVDGRAQAQATLSLAGDATQGRKLFVTKSCVTCHRVQDVGGRAAPALDAPEEPRDEAGAEFLAGMWRGAPIMVELQKLEIGYQIDLSGQDLLDLAAFATDAEAQKGFSIDEVPLQMRNLFLDQRYVLEEDLEDFYDRFRDEEWYPQIEDPNND